LTYEGNCRLGDLFESRRERGRTGLPLLSVTMNEGLVDREDLDRKQDTALTPEEHLLVRPGDIAYNMMRMWQGAFGLADREGVVSPAYVVLKPRPGIDPKYASFLLRAPRMQYLLWAYSYGITDDRLRLYYQDFARIPAWIHDPTRQGKIAAVLGANEHQISRHRDLLKNAVRLRAGMLNSMLKPKNRGPRARWKEYEFADIAERIRTSFDPSRASEQRWCIELEHVEGGIGQLIGSTETSTTSSTKLEFKTGDVLFGKLRPYLRKFWVADRQGVCSSEFWVLRPSPRICTPNFLACLLQSSDFERAAAASAGSKMPRAEWDYVAGTAMNVPPITVQMEVCRRLDPIDRYIVSLRALVNTLEYEHKALLVNLFKQAKVAA
jgi:type I restriction enzyme, S subunit